MAAGERVICASAELADGERGVRFTVEGPAGVENAFAIRHLGQIHAYVNRCPHMGTELDWQPGEFFEESRLYLICSTHGAIFEPHNGFCVAGPCGGASLRKIETGERDGQVYLHRAPDNEKPSK